MNTSKPAALDASLLARKGDAAPAIAGNSPLLQELGEPRPSRRGGRFGIGKPAADAPGGARGPMGCGLAWVAGHRVYSAVGLAVGVAILFAVTIATLTPSPDAPPATAPSEPAASVAPPAPAASAVAPEKITIPTDGESTTGASEAVEEAATKEPETALAAPRPAATATPREPPATPAAVAPPARSVAAAKPSGRAGPYMLQFAALPDETSARRELARLERRLGRILGRRKIIVVRAVLPGKPPVYRLRASAYASRAAARAACNQIRKQRMACIVVRR